MSVLDATDEQFEAFVKQVGAPVAGGVEGQRWSFDNRCRLINYARKYRLHLPFVDPNNSDTEQKTSIAPAELQASIRETPGMSIMPGAPTISGLANIFMGVLSGDITTNEHPLPPIVPTGGRQYPDLEEGE